MGFTIKRMAVVAVGLLLAVSASAAVQNLMVPKGTDVTLVFDQAMNSKNVKVGDPVKLHVRDDVSVRRNVILQRGDRVSGVISQVDHRQRYGVNAKMRIELSPVRSTYGEVLALENRSKGQYVRGKQSGKAARVTAGGAIVAGPVGLVGGYFIHGQRVQISRGDVMETEVARDTWVSKQGRGEQRNGRNGNRGR
jgi:hypothetical protein